MSTERTQDPDVSAFLVDEPPIPVLVVTGFLGSGKTTLLSRLLITDAFKDTAVIVNEIGEIGLDHTLLEVTDEQMALLPNGCLCCALRNDLVDTMRTMLDRVSRSEIPVFRRMVIETTGIADPAPILQTLITDPLRFSRFSLAGLAVTVDGVLGAATLDRFSVAVKQAAFADLLIITKSDLTGETASLCERLQAINTTAPIVVTEKGILDPDHLPGFGVVAVSRSIDCNIGHSAVAHGDGIVEASAIFPGRLDRVGFESWVKALLDRHGRGLLRLKGILLFEGETHPLVIQSVQHVFSPPEPWITDSDPGPSRLVLIAQEVSREDLVAALDQLGRAHMKRSDQSGNASTVSAGGSTAHP